MNRSMRTRNEQAKAKGGTRDDLGFYVRSKWEANYARYLKFLQAQGEIKSWKYEARTFEFPVKRGTRFYTPDFEVVKPDDTVEYHEVKGYDYPEGKTARKRLATHFPEIMLVVVGEDFFKDVKRKHLDRLLGWE